MKKLLFLGIGFFFFVSLGYAQPREDPEQYEEDLKDYENINPYENATGTGSDGTKCGTGDIMLNISIPFVGRCIKKDPTAAEAKDTKGNSTIGNVFPKLMGGLIRLVMTAIYIIGFLGILVGGFMITASGADSGLKKKGESLIVMIIGGLILLGASGIILNLINPDFFGVGS